MEESRPIIRRSRSGCSECRRRHRRCDERKPSCTYCHSVQKECCYAQRLSWGGRPFSRSRFGKCLNKGNGVIQIPLSTLSSVETSTVSFIYGAASYSNLPPRTARSSAPQDVPSPDLPSLDLPSTDSDSTDLDSTNSTSPLEPPSHFEQLDDALVTADASSSGFRAPVEVIYSEARRLQIEDSFYDQLLSNPGNLSWIPSRYRLLLYHFCHKTTESISCHSIVQNNICSALIPIALNYSHVLASILYLSACHRTSLGIGQCPVEMAHLKSASLRQLSVALSAPKKAFVKEAAIASTLTLCMAGIVSGGKKRNSWRTHLEGAMALLSPREEDVENCESAERLSPSVLLMQLYTSIQAIAVSCSQPQVRGPRRSLGEETNATTAYIDDLTGFSTFLLPVFEEINLGKRERIQPSSSPQQSDKQTSDGFLAPEAVEETCELLISSVQSMLKTRKPSFRRGVKEMLEPNVQSDFFMLDEAYHYMALLQIYSRAPRFSSQLRVDEAVEKILACISSMSFVHKPCPAVAALPPLFEAGLHARFESDRNVILEILDLMWSCYGMGNVRSSRSLLKRLWAAPMDNQPISWRENIINECWDIIPY